MSDKEEVVSVEVCEEEDGGTTRSLEKLRLEPSQKRPVLPKGPITMAVLAMVPGFAKGVWEFLKPGETTVKKKPQHVAIILPETEPGDYEGRENLLTKWHRVQFKNIFGEVRGSFKYRIHGSVGAKLIPSRVPDLQEMKWWREGLESRTYIPNLTVDITDLHQQWLQSLEIDATMDQPEFDNDAAVTTLTINAKVEVAKIGQNVKQVSFQHRIRADSSSAPKF